MGEFMDDEPKYESANDWLDEIQEIIPPPIPESWVDNPPHYQGNSIEVIDIIEDFDLNFHLGNAIKYILRCDKKGNKIQDLEKAIWYLQRECSRED
jgi:hypothetical protein